MFRKKWQTKHRIKKLANLNLKIISNKQLDHLKFMPILNYFLKYLQISDHIPCCFAYKVVCIDYKFVKPAVLYRGKHAVNRFIEVILEEYDYFKN